MDPLTETATLAEILDAAQRMALSFRASLSTRPVACPAPLRPSFSLPKEGLGALGALGTFQEQLEPGLSGSPGPRYLGFVTGGSTPAALAGDWLASAYDQNLSHGGDSVAAHVELQTLAMLRDLFGLPSGFEGVFVTGGTQANLVGLATGRQWAGHRLGVDLSEDGLAAAGSIPVLSGAPHASVLKALSILGIGRKSLVPIATKAGSEAVEPGALEAALRALGGRPALVVGNAGTVNTTAFDDLEQLADLCERHGAWLHVDGAFGLFAAVSPRHAAHLRGIERADSIATDAHKWLNVPYDGGVAFTRHLAHEKEVFRAAAAYLGEGDDLLHRAPENSRRFRALPAWMALMAYGRSGVRSVVERCCALAEALGRWIEGSGDYELLAPVTLNIACFAPQRMDTRDAILSFLSKDGRVVLTPTTLGGRAAIRAAFSNATTTADDLEIIFGALADAARGRAL